MDVSHPVDDLGGQPPKLRGIVDSSLRFDERGQGFLGELSNAEENVPLRAYHIHVAHVF